MDYLRCARLLHPRSIRVADPFAKLVLAAGDCTRVDHHPAILSLGPSAHDGLHGVRGALPDLEARASDPAATSSPEYLDPHSVLGDHRRDRVARLSGVDGQGLLARRAACGLSRAHHLSDSSVGVPQPGTLPLADSG